MLFTAIVPRAATALSLFLSAAAATQDGVAGYEGVAGCRGDIETTIFGLCDHIYGTLAALFGKVIDDIMVDHNDGRFHSDIKLRPGYKPGDTYWIKREFIRQYLSACKDPEAIIIWLMSEDPTHHRYEALLDLIDGKLRYAPGHEANFEITDDGKLRSEENAAAFKPRLLELLRGGIREFSSKRTVEHLNGVFTAETERFAFLHLLRRGGHLHKGGVCVCHWHMVSYDDLSELLADALANENREETLEQFVKPLMGNVVGLLHTNVSHAWHCVHAMVNGLKRFDMKESKKLITKMVDWKELSFYLIKDNTPRFLETAIDIEFGTRNVTECISSYHNNYYPIINEAALNVLSVYYLVVLDAEGRTRLKEIADDSVLLSKLPSQLATRLSKDIAKLNEDHSEAAEHLKRCLDAAEELGKKPFKLSVQLNKD
ncbi:hypothetical protein PAPHI01_1409 [Pancytospora philotis]|nr:hypothetical protein PAPHI01_1409 [Pancytospora philotis]